MAFSVKFTVVEEPSFTEQVAKMGDVQRIDDALAAIYWGVATNPYKYEESRRLPGLRYASTVTHVWDGTPTPALRVLFRICKDNDGGRVHLLAVMQILPGENDECD